MYRIFIVEDDEGIAGALENYLGSWGFEVKCAVNFRSIAEEFSEFILIPICSVDKVSR